ncbi:TPA: hypothetical protein N2D16_002813 [Clostridium botulinum]|nr:hypothetical protein [Clostridium botulinum]HCL4455191.1 hypothetical protein [Clostridium botulinum]
MIKCLQCNEEMLIHQGVDMDRFLKINKNGTISKTIKDITENIDFEYLECPKCRTRYDFSLDRNDKIIIGEEMDI